jgi:3'-5' exoribonuclease
MTIAARIPIAELTPGIRLEQVFVVSQPQLRTTTRGDHYIAAFLSDRTGKLNSRMWQASPELYEGLPQEGLMLVRGRTETYQGALQMVVDAFLPVEAGELDYTDFLPQTRCDIDVMFTRLTEILGTIEDPDLGALVQAFLADGDLVALLRQAPAAAALHHAWIGGLLEHTLSVLEVACSVLPHYPQLDRDLVLAGVFLHDIGKTTELEYDVSFRYSDQGRLLSHVVKGALLIQEKVTELEMRTGVSFPVGKRDCLTHIILSHHGTREFGAPVLPATPEAFFVHCLDNLDSKIALTLAEIGKDLSPSAWTSYIRAIEGPLYKMRADGQPR